ncbi:MAG: inositol monophosphatase family protein [Candidatus Sericytochromatia bacterium]|nr:inositol monophosphatase family protein [Candidatus Sericytochromatia bacterium]
MDEMLGVALDAARAAGELHLAGLGQVRHIRRKGHNDLVTDVDVASEQAIRSILLGAFPDHAIVGEESGGILEDGLCWVVDPLDGTTNYAHGFPFFAVSIALCRDRRPVLGVIHQATSGETFWATEGGGAFLNGQPIHVSEVPVPEEALVATGFAPDVGLDPQNTREFLAALAKVQAVRRPGSAALDLAAVACGRFDAFWEYGLASWDVAAGALLVTEAGGTVTGVDGGTFGIAGRSILATNGWLHDSFRKVLTERKGADR